MRMKKGLLAIAAASILGLAGMAKADTITVHDLTQDVTNGIFTYSIQLDAASNVLTNDGFVLYDFAGLSSTAPGATTWSITGGLSSSQFALTMQSTGNTLTSPIGVQLSGNTAATINGIPFDTATPNLVFSFVGPPIPLLGVNVGILTVHTNVLGSKTRSVYASEDHSGNTSGTAFSFADNPITVPAAGRLVPLPASALGGGLLFGLLGLGRMYKKRQNA